MRIGTAHLEALRTNGVTLMEGAFPHGALERLKRAAEECFRAIENGQAEARLERYRFSPFSSAVLPSALGDFGYTGELTAPLDGTGVEELVREATGGEVVCDPRRSWVRKRYAPSAAPPMYRPNVWHQDGGLGVRFGAAPGEAPPMTTLATCWIPLTPCRGDSPALEFVSRRLDALVHYSELDDTALRRRFAPEEFRAPELEIGDGLVFLNGTLHRTWVRPEMRANRFSVEYRFFPR